jgi:hypothetical protein
MNVGGTMKTLWPCLRIAVALLALAALARQLSQEIADTQAATTEWGSHVPTAVSNFFSYFTTLSSLAAAIALLLGAFWLLRTRRKEDPEPRWLALLLAYTSTYMITTGVVYNVLLRHLPSHNTTEAWTGETLHIVLPLAMLLDVLFGPRRRALGWVAAPLAVVFPLAWGAYTLIRGPFIIDPITATQWWYPYPFLNPHNEGWLSVGAYIAGIALAIAIFAVAVVWVGRRRGIRAS